MTELTSDFPNQALCFPDALVESVQKMGEEWANSEFRPKVNCALACRWKGFLTNWLRKPSLPLFIRKQSLGRGKEIRVHWINGGQRSVVPCDNSPAQWAFSLAIAREVPEASEDTLASIPVGMVVQKGAKYTKTLDDCKLTSKINGTGEAKLAHIEAVKIPGRDILSLSPQDISAHFWRLMFPGNMFVVPKKYAGIAELPEFLCAIREYEEKRLCTAIGCAPSLDAELL